MLGKHPLVSIDDDDLGDGDLGDENLRRLKGGKSGGGAVTRGGKRIKLSTFAIGGHGESVRQAFSTLSINPDNPSTTLKELALQHCNRCERAKAKFTCADCQASICDFCSMADYTNRDTLYYCLECKG